MSQLNLKVGQALTFDFDLLPDLAPTTVQELVKFFATPQPSTAIHVMYDGPAMMMLCEPVAELAPAITTLPLENASCYPAPGDMYWYYFPKHTFPGQTEDIWEVAIAYGQGVRLFNQLGLSPASVFARLRPDQIASLAEVGRSLRTSGTQQVALSITG